MGSMATPGALPQPQAPVPTGYAQKPAQSSTAKVPGLQGQPGRTGAAGGAVAAAGPPQQPAAQSLDLTGITPKRLRRAASKPGGVLSKSGKARYTYDKKANNWQVSPYKG